MENIIFYHGKCPDGFGAAYSAWKKFKDDALYIGLTHSNGLTIKDLPDVKNKNVYILDFSFDIDLYQEILKLAKSVKLLDHHKSAYQKLCGCKGCFFDMKRSGAMLAWQFFHKNIEPPYFIKMIQDGDLWKFKYDDTKFFYSSLNMLEFNFQTWSQMEDERYIQDMIKQGHTLNDFYMKQVNDLSKLAKPVTLMGYTGLMVNAPSIFKSELGSLLAQQCGTFALIWSEGIDHVKCSLRSTPSFDCLPIAQQFGGGGHPQASAFSVNTVQDLLDIIKKENL